MHESHQPWKLVQNTAPPQHTLTLKHTIWYKVDDTLPEWGGWELKPTEPAVRESRELSAPIQLHGEGGTLPRRKRV
jgi:hypothetical protein